MHKQQNIVSPSNNLPDFTEEDERQRDLLERDDRETLNMDINYLFSDNTLPIHYACLYNSLNYLTNPNIPLSHINTPGGSYGSTPLMFSIYNSSYKATLFLLLNDVEIMTKNSKSSDVVSLCARFDDIFAMILILSFIKGNIEVERYLKYSLMKKSMKVWEFLKKRGIEIEGGDIYNNVINTEVEEDNKTKDLFYDTLEQKGKTDVSLDAPENLKRSFKVYTPVAFFICISIYSNAFRLFASSVFIFTYFGFLSTPLSLIFNTLYSVYAYSVLLCSESSNFFVYALIFMHSFCFYIIYFMQNKYKRINKIKEAKHVVTHLILEDEYNHKNFCYTCLNLKMEDDKHCSICKRCIVDHNHHCPFFNKCISKKTIVIFNLFVFFSMLLYTVAIFKTDLRVSKIEFLICLFISLGSFVMFLIGQNKKNEHNKAKL